MKESIIQGCQRREMKWKAGAKALGMHPKALSRLKRRYEAEGVTALEPKKPGPKEFTPANRISEWEEDKIVEAGRKYYDLGPKPLAQKLLDDYGIKRDATTVWRVLRRRKTRYTASYRQLKKQAKLYCLESPGEEVQIDGSYPFGRARKVTCFSGLDDCSRYAIGRIYDRETADNAIAFVQELIRRAPFEVKRIRVDNRYGKKLREYCATLGIEVIENDAYEPTQNGKVERYHRTLKHHFFWSQVAFTDDMETMEYKHQQWLNWYNNQRSHSGYGMNGMTPRDKLGITSLLALSNTIPQKVTSILQQNNH